VRYGCVINGAKTFNAAVDLACAAEEAGWDGFFLPDGLAILKYPLFDPWVLMGAIAARTKRIRFGTMITPVSRRRPWKLARECVTADHLSGGRLILAVGMGAASDDGGFNKVGEATDLRVRAKRLDEGLEIINGLWKGIPYSFSGEHYRIDNMTMLPRPVQKPRIPIWVVGVWGKPKSMRRALSWDGIIPQKFRDWHPLTPDEVEKLSAHVAAHRPGKTPFEIICGGSTVERNLGPLRMWFGRLSRPARHGGWSPIRNSNASVRVLRSDRDRLLISEPKIDRHLTLSSQATETILRSNVVCCADPFVERDTQSMPRSRKEHSMRLAVDLRLLVLTVLLFLVPAVTVSAQAVTYLPYIQPGDNGAFGPKDQMVVAWQTDESVPVTSAYSVQFGGSLAMLVPAAVSARVVDNYLAVDQQFSALSLPFKYGAHSDYTAVLSNLDYNTTYFYKVTGPGLPASGFVSSFHTRKTGDHFVFQVQGDEGYYPNIPGTDPPLVANYEARIINTMFNAANLSLPGQPRLPQADLALNTGDNVYITGADSNYRDVWMPDWNSNVASNDRGAPFLRSIPLYIVDGNHDVGSTGATANLLADSGPTTPGQGGPGPFGGGVGGGDAMAHFNNYYFPLNGPQNVDIEYRFKGVPLGPSNFFFSYNNLTYNSPRAIEALRASTEVDTGGGRKRQIDHMSNYSFDYGNAHFVFLDANPHLFDNLLPGGPPSAPQSFPFPVYPSSLKDWLINDLDSSHQLWKIVVFHQPSFSSGNATISNDQMRTIARFLEDHGVNLVFNGHEHNYQRTLPLRVLPTITGNPQAGVPQVEVDTVFDGLHQTVPDGVLYFVEGAGGNRDFDDDLQNPRGNGTSIDQDDAATGTKTITVDGVDHDFFNGIASFLDTSLTDDAMKVSTPNAGTGPKITVKFKSKVFSFAHVTVDDNVLTLYQISEPLSDKAPASGAPFGTDYLGKPLNIPIPDTVFDPVTRKVVSSSGTGTPALLDKLTVKKPDISGEASLKLNAPETAHRGGKISFNFIFKNRSSYALNGTQAVVTLPDGVEFESSSESTASVHGRDVVISLGRTLPGQTIELKIKGRVSDSVAVGSILTGVGTLRSSTAMPIHASSDTRVGGAEGEDGH